MSGQRNKFEKIPIWSVIFGAVLREWHSLEASGD